MEDSQRTDAAPEPLRLIHHLREVVVRLDLLGAGFARTHDLHPTDVRALIALLDAERADEQSTPGSLGAALALNSASTTALVDRMEARGLVTRRRDTRDRRRVILEVSDHARELGNTFFGPAIGRAVASIDAMSPASRRSVQDFLDAITSAIETP